MGFGSQKNDSETERSFNSDIKDQKAVSKKSVKIADEELGPTAGTGQDRPIKSALVTKSSEMSRSRSKSTDVRRSSSRAAVGPVSPRRQIYEAKFDKYLANRQQKNTQEQRKKAFQKEDFDVTTKSAFSPSKKSQRFKNTERSHSRGKFEDEKLLP